MKEFRCPKCQGDTLVRLQYGVVQTDTVSNLDDYSVLDFNDDAQFTYDDLTDVSYECGQCGLLIGSDGDEDAIIAEYFKEVKE